MSYIISLLQDGDERAWFLLKCCHKSTNFDKENFVFDDNIDAEDYVPYDGLCDGGKREQRALAEAKMQEMTKVDRALAEARLKEMEKVDRALAEAKMQEMAKVAAKEEEEGFSELPVEGDGEYEPEVVQPEVVQPEVVQPEVVDP